MSLGRALDRIICLGLTPETSPGEARCVKLVNALTLLGLLASVGSIPGAFAGGLRSGVPLAATIVGFSAVLALSASRRLRAAQLAICTLALLSSIGQAINIGLASGVHYYLLPISFMPYFVFPPQRFRVALAFSITSAAAFVILVCFGQEALAGPWDPTLFTFSVCMIAALFTVIGGYARALALAAEAELTREHGANEQLLRAVLPERITEQLLVGRTSCVEVYDQAVILHADIAGFTPLAESMAPEELVELLGALVSSFDEACARHRIEKLKTVGDAYIAAAGIPDAEADAAARALAAAFELRAASRAVRECRGAAVRLRIGVACGTVAAGIVGKRRYGLELLGEALVRAEALQVSADPDAIVVDAVVRARAGAGFVFAPHAVEREVFTAEPDHAAAAIP